MLDALLRSFGLSTGRFTSPHLASVRERIVLNGESISPERFIEVYDDVLPYVEMIDARSIGEGGPALSTFEVLTAMAYAAFADAPVNVAIVEVGMGGRWDATNVVDAAVSVICPISTDHTEYLGETLAEIAGEKAGIITAEGVAVIAAQVPEAGEVLLDEVRRTGSAASVEGVDFGISQRQVAVGGQLLELHGLGGTYDDIYLPLHGQHQAQNAAVALAALESFLGGGRAPLDVDLVRDGFAQVASPGRLEVVRRSPTVIVDAAHNPAGVRASVEAVREAFALPRVVAVLGVLVDKDLQGIVEELAPLVDHVVVTRPSSPRALDVDDAEAVVEDVVGRDRVTAAESVVEALEVAVALADDPDRPPAGVLVIGSVVLAGEARALLGAS
jgi:dihydrofolate synthase/folylpolyglutamate synthase